MKNKDKDLVFADEDRLVVKWSPEIQTVKNFDISLKVLTLEQFKEQTKELPERKERTLSNIQQASEIKVRPNLDLSRVEWLTQKVAGMIQSFGFEEKREVLQSILESVTIGGGRKVFVKGYITLERYAQNVKFQPVYRNSRTPKCWEVNII